MTNQVLRAISSGRPYSQMNHEELHAWMEFYMARERVNERGSEAHVKIIQQEHLIAEYIARKQAA